MDGINFYKPYKGKVGNDYTYRIQELFITGNNKRIT